MIDTVVLILNKSLFQISDPEKFSPSAKWAEDSVKIMGYIQSRQNPTKKELKNGIYKPHLTLTNRINNLSRHEITLKIELSLPKLLFGNNFDELSLKDFDKLTTKLVNVLKEMGVTTTETVISQAPVYAIHYSKNIPLTDGSTPYHFISKIKAANVKLFLDVNQTDYRNDGHSYKWHCNAYEVVFYDKIRDLEKAKKSSKRSLEKDNDLQLNIFDNLKKRKKLEFLRMEVRLNKRQKIKQLFTKLKIKSDLTFKSLFKPLISKKILLNYLDELESQRLSLVNYESTNDKALLTDLILNNPEISPKQILQMFGLRKALDAVNIRELKVMFTKYNARSWYRLLSDSDKIRLPGQKISFGVIRESITKFKPVKLSKF